MNNKEKEIYINIRAEVIKHWQDTRNEGKFTEGGFSMEQALKLARQELNADMRAGYMRITLEELLLYSLEDCALIIEDRTDNFIKVLLEID